MDFHTLPRKQLQALCKKNKIPANMTNVAMADSLAALEHVEGIEEVWNPVDTDAQKFPDEKAVATPACRTSTRRKPVIEEPESSKISTRPRRGTRARNDEEIDQENKDLNVPPVTPAVPTTTRRRAPAVSTRRKKEDEKPVDHVPKTPAASNSKEKATSAYNTRKSTRLLEKGLSKMSLMDREMSEELSSVSQKLEDSEDTENGASSLAISTEDIEETDETESVKVDEIPEEMTDLPQKIEESEDTVEEGMPEQHILWASSLARSTEVIEETNETESVKVDEIPEEMTDLPQKIEESEDAVEEGASLAKSTEVIEETDETESVKVDEIPEQMTDLPQKIEESEDAVEEGADLQPISTEAIEKIDESEFTSSEKNTEFACQSNDSNSEMSLVSEEESDTGTSPQAEAQESLVQINESGSPLKDMNNSSESDIELTKSIAKEVNDANNESGNGIICQIENDAFSVDRQKSNEHTDMGDDDQNSVLMLSSHAGNETVVEMEGDLADFAGIYVSEIDDEVDASMVIEDKNEASNDHSNMGNDTQDPENNEEAVETVGDIQEVMISAENKAIETAYDNQNSEEMFSAENKVVETYCDIQNSEEMFSAAEKMEVEVEDMGFQTSSGIEEPKENVENDAVMEACNEPTSEGNTNVPSVADSLSFEGDMNKQKENQINDDLGSKSMRQLRKMLKNLTLDSKTYNDKTNNSVVKKDVERKRTALQELPENRMTASKGQSLLP